MSDVKEEEKEQLTKVPKEIKNKEKDPKKVAAGKGLAEYNKRAKEALQRERERESQRESQSERQSEKEESQSWLPELSFTTVLSLVGIGLTLVDLYYRYKVPSYKEPDPSQNQIGENEVKEKEQIKNTSRSWNDVILLKKNCTL